MATITIDPATRLEGHLKVKVNSQGGKVTYAKSSGMMFRGFENILVGKDPRDASHITQRICGVCPISHAMASCLAMEAAAGEYAPANARIMRNLVLGSNFLQSHILHFYHLALPSYVKGPDMPPWTPAYNTDMRFSADQSAALVNNYIQALSMRRMAHEMAAIFSAKMPHTAVFEFGGVTTVPNSSMITKFKDYLSQITAFIDGTFKSDVNLLAGKYPDYFNIGRGYGNLLAYGVFDMDAAGSSKLLARGRVQNGSTSVQPVSTSAITEQAKHSWYDDASTGRNPSQGITQPHPGKPGGYSWLKAPRYSGAPQEVGALARMWVNGDYRHGISVMDRHLARVAEASKIAHAMQSWVSQINLSGPSFTRASLPASGAGIGLTEAPRGAIGHWLNIANGLVASYQILTPTCWNFSPRDNSEVPGPAEKALLNTPVTDEANPVEVMRVVQSYDPCLSCAVH